MGLNKIRTLKKAEKNCFYTLKYLETVFFTILLINFVSKFLFIMKAEKIERFILRPFGILDENSLIERQQIAVFIVCEFGIMFISAYVLLLSESVNKDGFFYASNLFFIILPTVLLVLYWKKVVTLKQALFCNILLIQADVTIKMIHLAYAPLSAPLAHSFILINMTLLLLCFFVAHLSQIRNLNLVIFACSIGSYVASAKLAQSDLLLTLIPVFLTIFILVAFLTYFIGRMTEQVTKVNLELKTENEEISEQLKLNKKQLDALMSLAKEKTMSKQQISEVLELVGEKAEKNIRKKVRYLMEQEQIDYTRLSEKLPELTRSEIEICDLILKGCKLLEICYKLNKTETNISSQRSHIRTKLGLSPKENLKDVLRKKMMQD
jgi:DNA-binding CsgD family transcriptional regulator